MVPCQISAVVDTGASLNERAAVTETAETPVTSAPRVAVIRLPPAVLAGWSALALASVLGLLASDDSVGWPAQLFRYGYVVGHTLAIGLASAGLAWVFVRFVERRRVLVGCALLFLASLALSFTVLERDLSNFFASQEEAGSKVPWRVLAPAFVALAITAAGYVSFRLARPRFRLLPLAFGVLLAGLCQTDVLKDYRGVLFVASAVAALLFSLGLLGVPLPRALVEHPRARLVERGALGLALVLALTSLVTMPRPSVWRALFDVPGSLLSPYLARFRTDSSAVPATLSQNEWFSPRDRAPSIPPSTPSLLPKDPIVIFITVDAMRGDLLATDKYEKRLPNYTKIRREGVNFTMARSPSPATLTTMISLFTGKYYSQVEWERRRPGLSTAEKEPGKFLAELLKANGVRTLQIAVMGAPRRRGAQRGFDKIVATSKSFANADKAMDLILRELKRDKDKKGPLFLFSHFADPHYPYSAGKPKDSRFERYLGEVEFVDKQIGRLYRFLKKEKLLERTVLAFSADHGEAFGEHGGEFHAWGNFDEIVRVPLLLRVPGVKAREISTPVSLMDMRPTILDLLGIPTPGTDMGQSLVPYLRGEDPVLTRPIVVDAGRRIQSMVFPDNIKVTRDLNNHVLEVYDLNADPGEHHNLADDPRYGQGHYVDTLAAFFAVHTLQREGYEPPWRKF
jgi:arylsulfatase A-like enzyme